MSSQWFGQTFRKVHNLYVSPQWTKNRGQAFDAAAYADGLAAANVDCVELYCKDHHGNCYFPCSLGIPYPRDVLGEMLHELKKRNIRLIAYVSVCFDNYALGLFPEWRAVNYLGDPYKLGSFYMASICSDYTNFVLRQIQELVRNYDVDGIWLDIIPLARDVKQDLWMITPHPIPDYSLAAQRTYRDETGEPLPNKPTPEQAERIFGFMTGKISGFLDEAYKTIRQYRPEALVTYNGAGAPGDPIDSGDLISIEGHAPNYSRQSFIARWAKARSKPFEIMTAGGLPRFELGGGWNGFDQKPPTIMKLESAIAAVHGGSVAIGQAPYPNGSTDPGQLAGFAKVYKPLGEIESYLPQPAGISDIGLVLAAKPRSASLLWGQMQDGAEAFHEALLDGQIQFDIARISDNFSKYQGLILPDQAALSDTEIEKIRDYVRQGGKLIASGSTSLYDENGSRRSDFGLSDVFGVSFIRDQSTPFTYLKVRADDLAGQVTSMPVFVDQAPYEVDLRGASVLADVVYPETRRTDATTILWGDPGPDEDHKFPGICQHPFGKGVCWYVAVPLKAKGMPNAWIKQLMRVLANQLIDTPSLKTNAPPGVEVVLNQQAGRYVIHLVNYHMGDADRLSSEDHGIILHNIEIQINLARLKMKKVSRVHAPPAEPVHHEIAEDWLKIAAPPLGVHSLIVIE
jgi:hypothetical protein